MTSAGDAARSPLRGAAMAVALTWTMRAMGLVSVFIMARLLTPEDFGIVGLAITAVAFVELFSYLGLRQTLLRIEDPDRSYLDTAFTLQLGLMCVLGLILAALAPVFAWFYEVPELTAVVLALALRFVIAGAINIGVVDFDRYFQFGRDLGMRLFAKLASLAATVAAALILQSYWALVIGLFVQSTCQTIASYVLHPYRPRFSLARRGELIGVSIWMFLGTAAQIVHAQVDRVALGRVAGPATVGNFTVSKDLAAIFTEEIATALNRVSFVETTKAGELKGQGALMGAMLGGYAMVTAPMGIGLAAVAPEFFLVFLGDQWGFAAQLALLLAPAGAIYAVYRLVASSLQAGGFARLSALLSWTGTGATAALVVATVTMLEGGAVSISAATLVGSLATLMLGLGVMGRMSGVGVVELSIHIVRPFLAALTMFLVLDALPPISDIALAALLAKAAIGAAIYILALAALWLASGRPGGAERQVMDVVQRVRRDGMAGLRFS